MHRAFGSLYVVSGTGFYKVAQNGTTTLLGSVGSGPISIAHNVDTIVVVASPLAYYSDGVTAGALAQITDVNFTGYGARWVSFVDNYLIFTAADGKRFFWSDVSSAVAYDSLDFAVPEGSPDSIVGQIVDRRSAIFLNSESVEIFETTANGFERAANGFIEIGCFNGDTVAIVDNATTWMANDYTIRRLSGVSPQRISTYALEQFLTGVDVTTGRAYSYSQDGHIFYVLCFSTGCWAWDATTGEWAERQSHPEDYYRWQYHAEAYGTQYTGDAYSNKIGIFSPEVFTEYGDVQRMEWTYQTVYSENRRAIHDELEVVMETGVGLTLGQGSDPELMMAYSDDGDITRQNLPNRKIGKKGEYRHRVRWNALGSASQRVYRGAISDPIKVYITDTILKARGGRV